MNDDSSDDDMAADEAAAVLASVETEPGRTTDPVRMYMREMGTVDLLTREGEIAIAKRIEEGIPEMRARYINNNLRDRLFNIKGFGHTLC